jgi:hypothetical protein
VTQQIDVYPECAAWAAGLIDGEGCISLVRHPASDFRRAVSDRYNLILKVTMCCEKTVFALHCLFNTGSLSTWKPKPDVRASQSYTWICNARQAEQVLRVIRPFMVTKAAEADVALEFLALPLAARGGANGGRAIPASLQAERISCFERLRRLKTRSKFRGNKPGRKRRAETPGPA